jgi:hypothetical protein
VVDDGPRISGLDFWTPLLEGDEGRRAGNALGCGHVPDADEAALSGQDAPALKSRKAAGRVFSAGGQAGFLWACFEERGRCGWVPRRHSARAGGLAAALGDAGFGTPARRGSLPSPALGVSMLPAAGRRVPQLGGLPFRLARSGD